MLRGDWRLFAPIIGCLVLAGVAVGQSHQPQKERYEQYRYAADKPLEIDPALTRVSGTQPLEYRRPCHNPKGKDESDLCAQWRAAEAAENSAFWAKWGFWIAVVGSGFLLWQIALTRQAVEDTSEATDAMRKANEIAERGTELEYRPILVFKDYTLEEFEGGPNVLLTPIWENIGRLPARPIEISTTRIYVVGGPGEAQYNELIQRQPGGKLAHNYPIQANVPTVGASILIERNKFETREAFADRQPYFVSRNFALIRFYARYKAVVGDGSEWETESIVAVSPAYTITGSFSTGDPWLTGLGHGYEAERMS